jgi:CRP/FNR family cyclic AMP-dependent transcriptional regulator
MIHIASEETYRDGETIFEEGSSGDWVYVVLSGGVEISKVVGDKRVVIRTLRPEEIFGELGFLGNIKRTATARSVGDTTVGVVDQEMIAREFNKLSSDFREILQAVVKRLTETLELACRLKTRK